ncbi:MULTISPECIES: hypothetical protein [unclassified Microbacterium]|uniref:hypothetical protein n=1 Tax=unclassified Microbacterium TaxID=2609290 RepID=UPI002882EA6E|nr:MULTISPECIES: hypothetical protein [unclassified Microbacterium]
MGIMGFPSEHEITSMMGFVNEEDRTRWEKEKAASDARVESARAGLSARGLASTMAQPAMGIAERSINASLHAARTEEARNTTGKQTKRTSTTFISEEPVSSDEYSPEL